MQSGGQPDVAFPEKRSFVAKKSFNRGSRKARGVGSLLFDGDSSGDDRVSLAKKRSSSRRVKKEPVINAQERDLPYASEALGSRSSTGVPRVVSTTVSHTPEPAQEEFSSRPLLSPHQALQATSIESSPSPSQLRKTRDKVEPDKVGALVTGVNAMQSNFDSLKDWLSSQQQLTKRILEWQEKFEAGSTKQWRSMDEVTRNILQRQEKLEILIQSCVQEEMDSTGASAMKSRNLSPVAQFASMPDKAPADASPWVTDATGLAPMDAQLVTLASPKNAGADTGGILDSHCKFNEKVSMVLEDEGGDVECIGNLRTGDCNINRLATDKPFKQRPDMNDGDYSVHVKAHWSPSHSHVHHKTNNCVQKIVEHPWFEYMSALVILSHSIFIGLYVEYIASFNADGHPAFTVGNLVLTAIFLAEVFLKFAAEKKEFLTGHERIWNIFDLCLIFLVVLELGLRIIIGSKSKKKMKTVLKIAEMARTVRILRIFRFLKFSETLQVIIVKIFLSFRTLSWVMLLICMMQAVVAVCFTQGANEFLNGVQHDDAIELTALQSKVYEHFGSVPKSVKTVFASVSGGIMWEPLSAELNSISLFYALVFGLYIVASTFAILNIITGIFINDMLRAEKDLEEEHRAVKLEGYYSQLTQIFKQGRTIVLEDLVQLSTHPVIIEILDQLGMSPDDAASLFHLLDEENSGHLEVDEFLAGCLHLMSGSTGLDMKVLLYENRRLRHKVCDFMWETDESLAQIRKCIKGVDQNVAAIRRKNPSKYQANTIKSYIPNVMRAKKSSILAKVAQITARRESNAAAKSFNPTNFLSKGLSRLTTTKRAESY